MVSTSPRVTRLRARVVVGGMARAVRAGLQSLGVLRLRAVRSAQDDGIWGGSFGGGGDVEEELFEFAGDEHHVGAERVDQFAGGVGVEPDVAGFGGGGDPFDGVVFVDAGQFDDAAPVAEGFADAFVALFVLVVHLAEVGGDAEVVGYEEDEGLWIGGAEVGVDGGEFFFLGAAAVEGFQVADEEDLEGRHERWGLGAVEDLEDAGVGEVEVVEAEVAGVFGGEGGEDGFAAAVVEEDLVADEDVAGLDRGRGDFGDEAVGGGEGLQGTHEQVLR